MREMHQGERGGEDRTDQSTEMVKTRFRQLQVQCRVERGEIPEDDEENGEGVGGSWPHGKRPGKVLIVFVAEKRGGLEDVVQESRQQLLRHRSDEQKNPR